MRRFLAVFDLAHTKFIEHMLTLRSSFFVYAFPNFMDDITQIPQTTKPDHDEGREAATGVPTLIYRG